MDVDEPDDAEDRNADGDFPVGQSQAEMRDLLLGTEEVHVIGLETKHRSHRVVIETVVEEATCPACGSAAEHAGQPVRDVVDPERLFGKVVIFEWHARRWRCSNPSCATTLFEDELPPVGSARHAQRRKQ